jgi:hypothetical protein
MSKNSLFTLLVIFSVTNSFAQFWSWTLQVDGGGIENCRDLITTPDNGWVLGGSFEETIALDGWSATSNGERDALLAVFDETQNLKWAITGGGSQDDEIRALDIFPNGDIICAGSFWFNLNLGDTTLTTTESPRSLFTARFSSQGALLWVQQHEGLGLKEITDLVITDDGGFVVAGYYEQFLTLGDSTLQSNTDDGTTYSLIASFDGDGVFQWVQQGGFRRATRANAITKLPNGDLVIGGFFNDTTLIAGQQIIANAFDRDVFLAAYAATGTPLWAKKAGGVIDDELTALTSDSEGNIYATGIIVGLMTLSDDITIQTQDGNSDFFLLKYDDSGNALWGRALGGTLVQQGLTIALRDGLITIGGTFQGDMAFDGLEASAGNTSYGFVAGFNMEGEGRWLVPIPADLLAIVSAVTISPAKRVLVGGSFGQTGTFDQNTLMSSGPTSLFVGQLWPALTGEITRGIEQVGISVFPNPFSDTVFFDLPALGCDENVVLYLYNNAGNLLRRVEANSCIASTVPMKVSLLPQGTYHWTVRQGGQVLKGGSLIKGER